MRVQRGFTSSTTLRPPTSWWYGRPLSEAKNAHRTNTEEQFTAALRSGANWLEGDVRKELRGANLEMRHDAGHETGNNLTLDDWLEKGRVSRRGLKLDVKEPAYLEDIVRKVKLAGIKSDRLMWNLGDAAMSTWASRLRRDFPRAILAINPTGDAPKIASVEVARMTQLAKKAMTPLTFLVRADRITDEAIAALKPYGSISVWSNACKDGLTAEAIAEVTRTLRGRGVDGVIDLERGGSPPTDKAGGVDLPSSNVAAWVRNNLRQ